MKCVSTINFKSKDTKAFKDRMDNKNAFQHSTTLRRLFESQSFLQQSDLSLSLGDFTDFSHLSVLLMIAAKGLKFDNSNKHIMAKAVLEILSLSKLTTLY